MIEGTSTLAPNKRKRHLDSQNSSLKDKTAVYFSHLSAHLPNETRMMSDYTSLSNKNLEASIIVSHLIAQHKKPHTIAESLVVPCCREIIQIMLGPELKAWKRN